jgi:hypothetical protein
MALSKDELKQQKESTPRRNRLEMDLAGYLAVEQASKTIRYEYLHGYTYSFAGGTVAHSTISGNLSYALRQALGVKPCKVYNSLVRLSIHDRQYAYQI